MKNGGGFVCWWGAGQDRGRMPVTGTLWRALICFLTFIRKYKAELAHWRFFGHDIFPLYISSGSLFLF